MSLLERATGCRVARTSTSGGEAAVADAGELVVTVSYFYSGPAMPAYEVPPFDAMTLDSGLAAISQVPSATVYVPGHRALDVDMGVGGVPSVDQLAAFDRLIETIDLDERAPAHLLTNEFGVDDTPCRITDIVTGRLARGDVGGPTLPLGDGSWITLLWPRNWRARLDDDHRLVVIDDSGQAVAREWDEVELAGRGDENEFNGLSRRRESRASVSLVLHIGYNSVTYERHGRLQR